MCDVVNPAWENVIIKFPPPRRSNQALRLVACRSSSQIARACQFSAARHPAGLEPGPPRHQITDLDADDVAASQLAIHCQIEQRPIAKPAMLIEEESDCL